MRIYDKQGNQIGVQDAKGKNFFFKKEDNKNPPKDFTLKKADAVKEKK